MGWLIAAGILVLLAVLPLGVSAVYDAGGALAKLIVGPVRLTLYPAKSGKEKKKKPVSLAITRKTGLVRMVGVARFEFKRESVLRGITEKEKEKS